MEFMNHHERANRITVLHEQIGIKTGLLEGISVRTAAGEKLKNEILELQAELLLLQKPTETN